MTKADSREVWAKAWISEVEGLSRAYQCRADGKLFDKLRSSMDEVIAVIEEISNRMALEGVWKNGS